MARTIEKLDTSGLNCPLPILRAKRALKDMASGEVLGIISTDPSSVKDFAAFAKKMKYKLVESVEVNGEFHFKIRKA